MLKTKKIRLAVLVMSVVLAFSMLMGVLSFQDHAKLMAEAGTETDITSTISLEDKGTVEAPNKVRTFFIQNNGANILTSGFAEYWNDNGATNAAKNNNVDLMEKVLIDGVSMRTLVNENAAKPDDAQYKGPFDPMSWGRVYSPVQLGTGANFFYLRVLIEFKSSYTLTIKSGFEVTTASGERLYTTKDVNFAVTESSVTKIIPQTDITKTISVKDMGNPEHTEIRTLFIQNNGANILTSGFAQYWNDNGVANAAKNNNVDLMEKVLIDGVSMRDIVNENAAKADVAQYKGPIFPFTNGSVYSPVELLSIANDHIHLSILIAYKKSYTLTIKSGFSVMTADGVRLYTTKDIKYAVTADSVSKIEEYTLSFDAETAVSDITVTGGQEIGELPAVPEKEGYDGVWVIDGVEINADTIYTYGADKTAVAVYKKDVTSTLSIDHVAIQNGVHIFYMRNNGADIGSSFAQPYWNDNGVSGTNNAASNFGVDLMAYILVDGVSMRDLVNANAAKASEDQYKGEEAPWSWGGLYSPVQVSTESGATLVRVLNDFKTEFRLTIKAGFTLLTKDDVKIYTTKDIKYAVTADSISKIEEYTLSFEAETAVGAITVTGGQTIGELPAVPEKEGYDGVWTIDGVEINADTIYTYGADKTAVAVYKKDVTSTLSIDHVAIQDGVHIFYMRNNGSEIGTSFAQAYWNDHGVSGANNAAFNFGVDLMAYILVDGVSMRDLVNANAAKASEEQYKGIGHPWNLGGVYSPVQVCTESAVSLIRVLNEFKTEYTLTIKAGFTLVTKDGTVFYTTEDVYYNVTSDACTKVYAVSFNGANTVYVNANGIVEYPIDLSETKEETETHYYIYNWYLDGEIYDFATPVTKNINLTSDGTFTEIAKPIYYTVTFDYANGDKETNETVLEGSILTQPSDPEKVGSGYEYEFIGWYNGETKWDFADPVDSTMRLTAKYRTTKILTLSDLSNASTNGEDFKCGEVSMTNAVPLKGSYDGYATYPNFKMSYDFQFNGVSAFSTYTIKMLSPNAQGNEFYLGWHVYFYRGATTTFYVEFLKYDVSVDNLNGEGYNAGRKAIGFFVGENILANGTSYSAIIGYRVIDENIGLVELYCKIDGTEYTLQYELGAEYFKTAADSNYFLFSAEGNNGADINLKFGDVGVIGKARQYVTLMNGDVTVATANTYQIILPSLNGVVNENGLDEVFLGWTTNATTIPDLYAAGYTLTLEADTTLYAVWIQFEMQYGAAVRSSTDSGIRFKVDINSEQYTSTYANWIVDIGTIVVPTNYLNGVSFLHSSFTSSYYAEITKVMVEKSGKVWVFTEANGVKTYAAAFTGLSANLYARSLSARGFLKVNYTGGEGYVYTSYSEENNARSIYQVATSAYNDVNNPQYKQNAIIQAYVNSVADVILDVDFGITKNTEASGNYTITDLTDELVQEGQFKFEVTSNTNTPIVAMVINGVRVIEGYNANIPIGDFIYSLSDYNLENNVVTFTLSAASELSNKQNTNLVYFKSSSADLDLFLNDYYKRHAGGIYEDGQDQRVTSVSSGIDSNEFFWQEWASMAYYPINSLNDSTQQVRINGMREMLSGIPVDDYGYVWQSYDVVRDIYSTIDSGEHRMGWPFPTSNNTEYTYKSYKSTYSTGWDFNGADRVSGWKSNVSAKVANGMFSAKVSGQTENIVFTSPTLNKSYTTGGIWVYQEAKYKTTCLRAYYAPLLELDVRIDDASGVEDIVVHYESTKGKGSVSVNEKAFIKYAYSGKYEHLLFLPMYAEENWGDSESTYITSISVEIVMKKGGSMSGNVGLSYVRPTFDTRHSNNMSLLISSLRSDYDYTGDLEYLKENITRARKAMNFYMQMYDTNRALINSAYLVGHDAERGDSKAEEVASTVGNGYWDMSFMPKYDFHSNTYFYKALVDMAYLESVLESKGVTVDKAEATVLTAERNSWNYGTDGTYNYTASSLMGIASNVLNALQKTKENTNHTGFWDATKGRFVAGYSDAEGVWYDYGYTMWNMEAIYYGIATEAQAKAIMEWISGERTIAGDTSTGEDIYFFQLAPRVNTYQGTSNTDMSIFTGMYKGNQSTYYGVTQLQYGGADMYTTFYDLMSRIQTFGADNAYDRLTAIKEWYMDIYKYYYQSGNITPDDFYWEYYENSQWDSNGDGAGEYWAIQNSLKGVAERDDAVGIIGIDGEFLESILPIASIYYGFFGIDSLDGNTLQVAPQLPSDLEYWTIENLLFCDVKYDLTICENAMQITSISEDESAKALGLQVVFELPETEYGVYINGIKVEENVAYTVKDGKIYVNISLDNVIVEVR